MNDEPHLSDERLAAMIESQVTYWEERNEPPPLSNWAKLLLDMRDERVKAREREGLLEEARRWIVGQHIREGERGDTWCNYCSAEGDSPDSELVHDQDCEVGALLARRGATEEATRND